MTREGVTCDPGGSGGPCEPGRSLGGPVSVVYPIELILCIYPPQSLL